MSLAKRLLMKLRVIKAHTSSTTTSPRTSLPVENIATTGTAASTLSSPLSSSIRDDHDDDDLLLLRRVFSEFDKNSDGRISAAELGQVSRAIASLDGSLVEADADAAVAALDLDGDGFIDFHEFTACIRPAGVGNAAAAPGNGEPSCSSREEDAECLRSAFAVYDWNGDGVITAEELQLVLTKLIGNGNNSTSLADCKKMIRAVDRNGDGVVSFEEFVAMMTQRKPARIRGSTVVTA